MPFDIKKAVIALVISCVSTLLAVYFDGHAIQEISFDNPLILGTNLIWALVVAWIIWDLTKGKNIKPTLMLVGAVLLAFVGWEVFEYGFGVPQMLYALELAMFGAAYFFVSTEESLSWCKRKLDTRP
ncbi:hypothetical protein HZ993_10115 [Rhodoferax sp. AJA081-3]|uniref:hypothetical protein n=1 Tax=Rhodoferax sp. AJA081-3 TaxID=2752316 RepID=UPI001ADF6BCB|nr:hypothetical protein [Rhodoferax sp. AJA081-3]QTN30119.1 hypothetical protein HZ993_10115 [Rhodoferax sp. AJA081-3]